jgi:hypothetical protein
MFGLHSAYWFPSSHRGNGAATSLLDLAGRSPGLFLSLRHLISIKVGEAGMGHEGLTSLKDLARATPGLFLWPRRG